MSKSNVQSIIASLSNVAGYDEKSGESLASKAVKRTCATLAASLQLEQDKNASDARDELAIAAAKRRFRVAKATRSERISAALDERLAVAQAVLDLSAKDKVLLQRSASALKAPKVEKQAKAPKVAKSNGQHKAPEGEQVLPA